jgi:hypothetical protein
MKRTRELAENHLRVPTEKSPGNFQGMFSKTVGVTLKDESKSCHVIST